MEGLRRFTLQELSRYNGRGGMPAYVACLGKVYDVSQSCYHWRDGRHQVIHYAGTDLTDQLAQAPHGSDKLERFPVVGILVEEE